MIADLDIYHTANLLIRQHGQDAPIHAAMRADAMLEKGDPDGYGEGRATQAAGGAGQARLGWSMSLERHH